MTYINQAELYYRMISIDAFHKEPGLDICLNLIQPHCTRPHWIDHLVIAIVHNTFAVCSHPENFKPVPVSTDLFRFQA